jgi:hypothetical protein
MFRKQYSLGKHLAIATALAMGLSGIALADDSSMNPFNGEFYRELHAGQNFGNSSSARATRPPIKGSVIECAKQDEQRVTQTGHLGVVPAVPLNDKGV